jgi:23S rRNA pseudouridine2605 synthase
MKKRLQTILAHAGVSSRRGAEDLIAAGRVKVDGRTVTEKGLRVDPEENEIFVDGKGLPQEKKHYFLFNKPKNVISTVSDTHGRKKVTDYFRNIKARLYPVGRLDKDTTGILLVTNDGGLAHRLTHPSFEIDKEYMALVKPRLSPESLRKLREGLRIEGKMTHPCSVEFRGDDAKGCSYKIIIHEGRKRQIRYMFKAVGSRVIELKRVRYAGLALGRLKEGESRELTEREVEHLRRLGKQKG